MELQELHEELQLSAQVGKQLLEKNSELVRQNEEQLQEFSARTEELEQQNHQLRTEVRLLKTREKEAQDESREEQERSRLVQERADAERLLNSRSLDDGKQEIEKLYYQLDEKKLLLEHQGNECSRQASQICELQGLLSSCSKSDAEADNHLLEMQVSLTSEQCQRMEIAAQLSDAHNQIERLQLDKAHLTKDLSLLKESSGEQSKQVRQWGQALESSREEIALLRSQLDCLQSSQANSSHAVSGNSLFGELEDERQKYEAEAVTLRVKYRSLEKQHSTQRQQLRQLKAQLHALFQLSRSRADQDELQRLKRKVAESSSVVQTLRARLAQVQDVQGATESIEHLRQLRSSFQRTVTEAGDTATSDLYVEFLQRELELVRLREKETRKELDTSRIQLIAESDKLHQAESQIHQLEVELSKARSASVQARLRLDEMAQRQASKAHPDCSGANCKGHSCDSMYRRPMSPHLKMGPACAPRHKAGSACARQSRSSLGGNHGSSSPLPLQCVASPGRREPLQELVGKENVPAARTLQPKASSDAGLSPRQKAASKRLTVHINSEEEDCPGECSQQ